MNFFLTGFVTSFFPSFRNFKQEHFHEHTGSALPIWLKILLASSWLLSFCFADSLIGNDMSILWAAVNDITEAAKLRFTLSDDEVVLESCEIIVPYGYLVATNLWRFHFAIISKCNHFHNKTWSCKGDDPQVLSSFFQTLVVALHKVWWLQLSNGMTNPWCTLWILQHQQWSISTSAYVLH